ncbi:hypothetical protein BB559_003978 [Furculomyces boomerangus]|uniref:HTH TFE/IIEalpha-type domain-containing protein n=1 Tax=Furculomyces boomerangus TaxID=61424 RepID=A0A2T9YHL9_9FUNG|nr:hypothetical protein BB559_003978 [Furculomyces boomerangus]
MVDDSVAKVQKLVSIVARAFYSDTREDEIGRFLQVPIREVHKICGRLREDKLLRSQARMESRKSDQKPISRTYYHLDYKLFVDVVKWRMWKLQEIIKGRLEVERSRQGFICPNCKTEYSTMQVLSLVDFSTGLFKCELCSTVLEDNSASEVSLKSQEVLSQLMEQCRPVLDTLKQTDSLVLPQPIPFELVIPPDLDNDNDGAGADTEGSELVTEENSAKRELSVARDTGLNTGEILIEFDDDITPEQELIEREKKIEEKLLQNALPPWHVWSTISDIQMVPDNLITPSMIKLEILNKKNNSSAILNKNILQSILKNRMSSRKTDHEEFDHSETILSASEVSAIEKDVVNYYIELAKSLGISKNTKKRFPSSDIESESDRNPSGMSSGESQRYFDNLVSPNLQQKSQNNWGLIRTNSGPLPFKKVKLENNTEYDINNVDGNCDHKDDMNGTWFKTAFVNKVLADIDNENLVFEINGTKKKASDLTKNDLNGMTNKEYSRFWSCLHTSLLKILNGSVYKENERKTKIDDTSINKIMELILSPSGGWWSQPKAWKKNTFIVGAGVTAVVSFMWYKSAQIERRTSYPHFWIPSMLWAKQFKEDDPNFKPPVFKE